MITSSSDSKFAVSGRQMIGLLVTCVILAILSFFFVILGGMVAAISLNVPVGVATRTVLVVIGMFVVVGIGYRVSHGGPRWLWLTGVLASYLIQPAAWMGKMLVSSGFDLNGYRAVLLDALVWFVFAFIVVWTREPVEDDHINLSRLH